MGHPHGRRHSARLLDHARRRRQRTGCRLRAHQVRRMAEEICAAGSRRHGLPRGRRGTGTGPYRPADLLVQRVHRGALEARSSGHEQGRHAEMAHGSEPAWRLLEGGHEARLSGRRLLDAAQICAAGKRQGRLALLPVLRLEDGFAEKVRHLPARHPRERHPASER